MTKIGMIKRYLLETSDSRMRHVHLPAFPDLLNEETILVQSHSKEARLLKAIDTELKKHGYSMLIPEDDLAITSLPNGAILATYPGRKPVAILINAIEPYTFYGNADDVS